MKRDRTGPDVLRALESLREIPEPDAERQEMSRTLFLQRARALRLKAPPPLVTVPARRRVSIPRVPRRLTRFAASALAVALVLALVASSRAVAYAADDSVPGEPLYGIDRAMEWAQLSLTRKPLATVQLLLSFADERLLEAEELSAIGDQLNLEVALDGYGSTVAMLAETLGRAGSRDAANLAALVDQSFAVHSSRLADIFQDIEVQVQGDTTGEAGEPAGCVDASPSPVALRLAERYGESPEQVMAWFCEGYGLGEIMHALSTAQEAREGADVDAGTLLARKRELGGWGLVWQELGLIGPRREVPAGPPEEVGPPAEGPVGPGEGKPGGGPSERPAGPPQEVPAGPPQEVPAGPPDDKPGKGGQDKSSW